MNVKDKVIIVTGSSRGIGRKIAEKLAEYGAKLVITSTKQDTADSVAKEVADQYGVETLGIGVDVSDPDAVKEFIKKVVGHFERIDVLINNAGITKDNLLMRLSEDDWKSVIDTNLNSVFYTTKAVIRPMLKQKGGKILNITSVVGLMGNPGQTNYAASKAGIIGFTKSVAKEYGGKGIICNAVAPGFIETDMIETLPEDYLDNIIKQLPLGRLGTVEDIANVVLFLSSDLAMYTTGQTIQVDGGILM